VLSSLKTVEIHIEHPYNENAYIEAIEDPTEKIAYKTWVTQNSIIYLVLDYMNFMEFKAQLPKQTFLNQKLFGYMSELEVDKVKEGAQILSYNFKTIKMKQKEVMEISRYMLKYAKVLLDDSKRTKEDKKRQEELIKDFRVPGLSFVEQSKKLGSNEIT